MPRLSVVILGPAGSGKTLLAKALGSWLEKSGISVDYVNLDPAVESLPYNPSFDARSIVRTRDVMVREGLGPNGAIVRAIDILAEKWRTVYGGLRKLRGDHVIVDTPGQMEVLMFRSSGISLMRVVKRVSSPVGVFLLDSTLGLRGTEAAVSALMAAIAQLRLEIPVVPVLSKCDAAGIPGGPLSPSIQLELERIVEHLERRNPGVLSEMLVELVSTVKRYLQSGRLIAVSSITGGGIEDLYKLVLETFCACGDLT